MTPMRPRRASMRAAIDPDQDDWLRAEAVRRRCSVGQVVRTIVLEAMEGAARQRAEALDRMRVPR